MMNNRTELLPIIGSRAMTAWDDLVAKISALYSPEMTFKEIPKWEPGKPGGMYELKFIKGGRTLCAFYARPKQFGFMIIFGRSEQEKFETARKTFPKNIQKVYDETHTYHDGKWMMFPVANGADIDSFIKLLAIKRKPKKAL